MPATITPPKPGALLSPETAAELLRKAAQDRTAIPPLRDRVTMLDQDAAYAVQEINTKLALVEGRRLVGRKIGLTSLAVQTQLGVNQPDFGMLFADMSAGDGEPVELNRLIQPKVEAEVALVLGRDLAYERHTYADLIRATEYALPAIEIVDSRIENWNIRFFDTVADNASSAMFVVGGQPVTLDRIDLTACVMEMKRGEEIISRGNGRACLGSPLNAAIWLADMMVHCGRPLQAGDIVLTGALGPMMAVTEAARFDAYIEGLGGVSALFV